MLKIYKFLISVLFIHATSFLTAQDVDFHSINNIHNLTIRETNSICRDDNGFIWIASKTGIIRIGVDNYRIYQLPYENANIVFLRITYRNGMLITYSNNGQTFIYNEITDKFETYINIANILNNSSVQINKIAISVDKSLWIASVSGLYKAEGKQLKVIDSQEAIENLEWYNDSLLFLARRNDIKLANIKTPNKYLLSIPNPRTRAIKTSLNYNKKTNSLWIGTKADGIFRYDLNLHSYIDLTHLNIPKQPVLTLKEQNDTTLLAGIDGQGIWVIDNVRNKLITTHKNDCDNPNSLQSNGVYDLLCIPNKQVWVCTYDNGAVYYNTESQPITQITHQTKNTNSLSNDNVNAIYEDSRGNIWFATNNGVNLYNPQTNKWQRIFSNEKNQSQVFLALNEDSEGRIWAGSYSSGVYVLDGQGREIAHYSKSVCKGLYDNDFVFDIIRDCNNDMWIGGVNDDIFRYNHRSKNFNRYSYVAVNAFAELNSKTLIMACIHGLVALNKETGAKTMLINRNIINDIYIKDSIIWAATSGYGLRKFDLKNNQTEQFDMQSGLPSNFVTSIIYANGFLWLGTEMGLCKFDPNNNSIALFPSIPQLSSMSFNRGACSLLKNGQLIFGTNKGAICFNPNDKLEKKAKGDIYIQDIAVSGRSIRNIQQIKLTEPINKIKDLKLNYTQNTLRVELLPTGNIEGAKFSWFVEGLDNEWTQPTTDRIISYSNMPSKQLCLHIRMYNNTMSDILDEHKIQLTITPPFWRSWWFLTLLYGVLVLVIFILISHYITNLKRQHTEDKIRFFTNTTHDMRTSLTLIKGPIEEIKKEQNLSQQGTHYLNLALAQVSQLISVVTQLMDFQKNDIGKDTLNYKMIDIVKFVQEKVQIFDSLAFNNKLALKYQHNVGSYVTAIDTDMIGKVIDNLISNAIKYSPDGGDIIVELDCDNNQWTLTVTDHGIGISEKAQKHLFTEFYRSENAINSKVIGSGIGLMIVKNYVMLHNGKVSCSSKEGYGTKFSIEIPYNTVDTIPEMAAEPTEPKPQIVSKPEQDTTENETTGFTNLLIVEDNDNLLNFMKDVLSDSFNITTATNGAIAWEIIKEHNPDIILSDIMMPQMDGFELCRLVKSTYETSHIPVVLLTALSEKTEQLKGLGLGADDYLTKPFDTEVLRQRLATIINNRKVIKQQILNSISNSSGQSIEISNNNQNNKFLNRLREVVKNNMSNTEFGKEQFAMEMNVSTSLLYKKIKALTDQSPTDFIKTVRLEYAMQLLKTREYNITEVSEMCGFASAGYFSTVFKRQYGISPSEILE